MTDENLHPIDKQDKEYAGSSLDGNINFYITFSEDQQCFIADVFDSKIEAKDYSEAYIESFEFDSMEEAIEDLKHYQLGLTIENLK